MPAQQLAGSSTMTTRPSLPAVRRVRVPKTAELVAADLRNRIVRRELLEGDSLPPEADLLAQFGVSRPTLREAFRILESEAFITVRRGSRGGAQVQGMRPDVAARYAGMLLQAHGTTLADLHEARSIIEPAAARMLAERPPRKAVAALRDAVERHRAATDAEEAARAAAAFHVALLDAAGNTTLSMLAGLVTGILEAHRGVAADASGRAADPDALPPARRLLSAHSRLVDLIEQGRPEEAESFWRDHLGVLAALAMGDAGSSTPLDILI